MLEDVERDLEGRARDLDVRCPAAELLVVSDGRGEDRPIDLREEGRFGLGDFGGRRGDEPGAGLPVSVHEAAGTGRAEQPPPPGGARGKRAAAPPPPPK